MMWWGYGYGWWWAGAVFMVVCMGVMAWMMIRMMGHGHREHDGRDEPARTLADRLARGEIDIDEYERLLGALRRPDSSARA